MQRHDRSKRSSALTIRPNWQGFTFVSQNHQKAQDTTVPSPSLQEDSDGVQRQWLSQAQVGDRVRIITLPQFANDLTPMGLTSGIALQIVSRTASGSVIVSLSGKNLGIGSAIAQTIVVEPL